MPARRRAPSISRPPPSAWAWRRKASRCATARSSGRAICAPATGSWPRTALLERDATRQDRAQAGRRAPVRGHGRGPPRYSRQGVRPAALHPRPGAARPAARPRAAAAVAGRDAHGAGRSGRPGRAGRHGRGARRQLRRRRCRDRGSGAGRGRAALRKAATWGARASRCPTRPTCAPGSRASRSRPRRSTRARQRSRRASVRTLRRQYSRPFIAHASMAPSCAIAQWTGRQAACVDPQPGRLQPARRPGAGLRACRPRASSSSTSRAPAATARTAPTTWASRPRCWPARSQGRPVRLQWSREDELAWAPFGAAHGHRPGSRSRRAGRDRRLAPRRVGQRPRVAARPRQDADAARRLAARQAVPALHRRQSADGRRRRRRAQRRRRSTTSRPGRSPAIACSPCRSAPRRCARWARSPTCSPSSRSWTSWRPSAARTRWPSACAT